jgi:short-subunit dehydrogenase
MTVSQVGLAVITGAAGGLGSSFAHKLAERGHRLLLVDRRQKQLEQVCASVTARHGALAEPWAADLCNRDDVEGLAKRLDQLGDVELLVNNAGFGTFDYFVDTDANYLVNMALVHVVAPTILTRAVLKGMIERDRGAVINVASVSAWFQSACNVQYSSTKCYLAAFSLALAQELRGTNVRVQALCPGFIRTEFHEAESMKGFNVRCTPPGHLWMSADDVAGCSLRQLTGRRVIVIPGFGYGILGRLAQMPMLQPLMQWATRAPRVPQSARQPTAMQPSTLQPNTEQAAGPCSAPALEVAESR